MCELWFQLLLHCKLLPALKLYLCHILVNQGPRKYYVHNDIFHYQDEVFSEETSDEPADGTVGKEISSVYNHKACKVVMKEKYMYREKH